MLVDPEDVRKKLELLKSLDKKLKKFGASSHRYELNRCLQERQIKKIESKYGMRLPDDYRHFISNVGNGGAGPYHGLFKLGEHDDGFSFTKWDKGYLLGDPSAPFKYKRRWNLPKSFWNKEPDESTLEEDDYDDAMDRWNELEEQEYWRPSIMDGAIPICHLGCAYRQWLVISGHEGGNIWCDDRADRGGLYPLLRGKRRVDFTLWYTMWLDDCLGKRASPRLRR